MSINDFSDKFIDKTILIVEDEQFNLDILKDIFSDYFLEVLTATNGEQGLNIFQKGIVDMVLCDINMPKVDGLAMIEYIRKNDFDTPIIITTAHDDKEKLLQAANLNIQGYIIKPIDIEIIHDILRKFLKHKNNESFGLVKINDKIVYDKNNLEIIVLNQKIPLTKKESSLLELLLKHKGKVVQYSQIEELNWEENGELMSSAAIRTLVKNLRKKFHNEMIIQNISKIGYKLL